MKISLKDSYVAGTLVLLIHLSCAGQASADIIVDLSVEPEGTWTSSGRWHHNGSGADGLDGTQYFSGAVVQEGNYATHSNNHTGPTTAQYVENLDVSGGAHTLQEGTYTIYFAVGNYNNWGFAWTDHNLTFAGLSATAASASSTATPASGGWELWSYTWDVSATDANIGNALSFHIVGTNYTSTPNASLDGVGALSDLGTGFLVDFSAPASVPEPGTMALLGIAAGLGITGKHRFGRKKNAA